MFQQVLTFVAGVLFVIGFLPYVTAIVRGKTKPAKTTWIIWASLDTITLCGMFAKEAINGQIIGAVAGAWIVVALALKFGTPGWTKLDKFCLAGAVLGVLLWQLFSNPLLGIATSLSIVFLGSIPTFVSAWHDPSHEDKLAWTIFWMSCVAAVLAIPSWTIADALQPLTFFTIEMVMMYILYFRRVPNFLHKKGGSILCEEIKCDGEIDTSVPVSLQIGCHSYSLAHPSAKCGRVHWPNGNSVFNRRNDKVFLEDGEIVFRDDNNQVV